MKKIIINIDALGRPTVEADGFAGVGCEAATKAIEEALSGSGGVDRNYKPEYLAESNEQHEEVRQW